MRLCRCQMMQDASISITDQEDSINLAVEDQHFLCSRTKLISNSEYFNVMLSRYYEGGAIKLKEIDGNSMQELLRQLSSRSNLVQCSDLAGVIILCDMFLFESLKKKMICQAYQRLSKINCLRIWIKLEILHLIPLVWKAKSLSLTTFAHQRDIGSINTLELSELLTYLGHANLQCGSEMNVFHSIIQWITVNQKDVSENSLKQTLGCINYKDISYSELSFIKMHDLVSKYDNIVKILGYITELKHGVEMEINNENIEIAQAWFSSRKRYLPKYLFVFNDEFGQEIFYHGHHKDTFIRKVATVISKSIAGLTGGEIQAYGKMVYIFGGEFSMGKGLWNDKFWVFNLNTQQLTDTGYGIPKRRHFKSCIVGDDLFIIGGTGSYRVRKNDMHLFNFTTEKWKNEAIPLPCCQTSIKYCDFNGKLFILDCASKHGYIFIHDMPWKSVNISESVQELMEGCSLFSMFAYRGNLFFKGKTLLELELVADNLVLKKLTSTFNYSNEVLIDTVISNNQVYSMYADDIHGFVKLQYLNLDTLESIFIENIGLYYDSYLRGNICKIDKTQEREDVSFTRPFKYNPNKMTKMFLFHNYEFCDFEDLLVGDV